MKFAAVLVFLFLSSTAVARDCAIGERICLVDNLDPRAENVCLTNLNNEDASFYIGTAEKIFALAPPPMRDMMCSVDKIFVVNKLLGRAAGTSFSIATHNVLGVRADMFKKPGLGWNIKRQLNIFFSRPAPEQDREYEVRIESGDAFMSGPGGVVYAHVAHELGHLLDARHLPEACRVSDNCGIFPGTFGALAWSDNFEPKAVDARTLRQELCFPMFEGCNEDADEPVYILGRIQNAGFVTPFALGNSFEDFAVTYEYMMLAAAVDSIWIESATGARMEMLAPVTDKSSSLRGKVELLSGLSKSLGARKRT